MSVFMSVFIGRPWLHRGQEIMHQWCRVFSAKGELQELHHIQSRTRKYNGRPVKKVSRSAAEGTSVYKPWRGSQTTGGFFRGSLCRRIKRCAFCIVNEMYMPAYKQPFLCLEVKGNFLLPWFGQHLLRKVWTSMCLSCYDHYVGNFLPLSVGSTEDFQILSTSTCSLVVVAGTFWRHILDEQFSSSGSSSRAWCGSLSDSVSVDMYSGNLMLLKSNVFVQYWPLFSCCLSWMYWIVQTDFIKLLQMYVVLCIWF